MARLARVVAAGIPHHVTQRGNWRQQVFLSEADYQSYAGLLAESCRKASAYQPKLLWCELSVVSPEFPDMLVGIELFQRLQNGLGLGPIKTIVATGLSCVWCTCFLAASQGHEGNHPGRSR
jgi:hypothetical protein